MTNKNTEVKKSNRIWIYLVISLIICGFLLSFHILTSEFTIVAKNSLTFQKTFITEDDEIEILEKIYFGSLIEQSETLMSLVRSWSAPVDDTLSDNSQKDL